MSGLIISAQGSQSPVAPVERLGLGLGWLGERVGLVLGNEELLRAQMPADGSFHDYTNS